MSPLDDLKKCPRWRICSAAICPLLVGGIHMKGERVCLLLTESVKVNAKANFEGAGLGHMYERIQTLAPAIVARWHPIRDALERASKTGSKLTAFSKEPVRALA